MLDFSRIPPPSAPEGATVVGNIVELLKSPFPTTRELENQEIKARLAAESTIKPEDSGAVVDLNIDGARRALKLFDAGISEMEKKAEALVVNTAEAAEIATEMAVQTLRLGDKIDDRRKEIIKEPDSYVRQTNAFVKPMQDRIKKIAGPGGIIKRKLNDYTTRTELERRESERKIKEAADRLQDELDAEAKAKNVEPVKLAPVVVPVSRGPIRSSSGSSSSKMITIAEVTDISAVPRSYLEDIFKKRSDIDGDDPLDGTTEAIWSRLRTRIMEAHTAGLRDIPGVNFKERSDTSIRRVG